MTIIMKMMMTMIMMLILEGENEEEETITSTTTTSRARETLPSPIDHKPLTAPCSRQPSEARPLE